jgi:hypothetical protein
MFVLANSNMMALSMAASPSVAVALSISMQRSSHNVSSSGTRSSLD